MCHGRHSFGLARLLALKYVRDRRGEDLSGVVRLLDAPKMASWMGFWRRSWLRRAEASMSDCDGRRCRAGTRR